MLIVILILLILVLLVTKKESFTTLSALNFSLKNRRSFIGSRGMYDTYPSEYEMGYTNGKRVF